MNCLHFTAIAALAVSLAASATAVEPYLFGRNATRVTEPEVQAILAAAGGAPWALRCWSSQVLPEVRYVNAFLPPTLSSARVRRGLIIHLECRPTAPGTPCLVWKATDKKDAYAQVAADGMPFTSTVGVRTPLERPFSVAGHLSERALLSLITFVRKSPSPQDSMAVDGALPVEHVEAGQHQSVSLWLSLDGGSGQQVKVAPTQHGWNVVEVVGGVS